MKGRDGSENADPSEGLFLEPLGLSILVERRQGRLNKIIISQEEPEIPLPPEEGAALLRSWLLGGGAPFELLDLSDLTEFQKEVLGVVAAIPPGETLTYGDVARKIGRPNAVRAVGTALSRNPFPLVIPCHRVVGSSGPGGYRLGIDLKRRLLDLDKKICQR